ncbi:MAG: putative transport system permease protein, partial [Actinomycetota bacterium]
MAVVLAFALIVGLAVSAIRSPLVRRIGFRNAVRRPREAMLVMLGCVLGTALIVGSGSVADSFTASIRDQALNKLGAIDAHVTYESAEDWSASNARLNTTRVRDVRAAAAAETLEVPLTSNRSSNAAPRAKLVEVDYRRAAQLAPSKGVRAGSSPAPGTAWVSRALANRLALRPGSLLTLHSKVPGQRFRVTKIVNSALVTFVDSSLDSGQNLLVSPGTIAKIQQQDPAALVPRYLTLVEATGRHTKAPPHPAAVERLRATLTDLITPFNGSVAMV